MSAWLPARIASVETATPHARLLRLDVPGWPGSLPGQHVDVRLTAEDGYQAVRSYSLAAAGPEPSIELAVDEVPDGEVSPYLVRDARPGDDVEVLGPLGGYFVWRPENPAAVQLIAGGSGIVPLRAIGRARLEADSGQPFRLLYSVKAVSDAIYRDEIDTWTAQGIGVQWAYTREAPEAWGGRVGRVDAGVIDAAVIPVAEEPTVYVCGPTGFVEAVARALVDRGHPAQRIKTERFGGA